MHILSVEKMIVVAKMVLFSYQFKYNRQTRHAGIYRTKQIKSSKKTSFGCKQINTIDATKPNRSIITKGVHQWKKSCFQSPECINECVEQQLVKTKKKRNRNPLLPNYRESMVVEVSQSKNYYFGGLAIEDIIEKRLNGKSRAQKAAIASREPVELSSAFV